MSGEVPCSWCGEVHGATTMLQALREENARLRGALEAIAVRECFRAMDLPEGSRWKTMRCREQGHDRPCLPCIARRALSDTTGKEWNDAG